MHDSLALLRTFEEQKANSGSEVHFFCMKLSMEAKNKTKKTEGEFCMVCSKSLLDVVIGEHMMKHIRLTTLVKGHHALIHVYSCLPWQQDFGMLEALALSLLIRHQMFQNSLSASVYIYIYIYIYALQMKIDFLFEGEFRVGYLWHGFGLGKSNLCQ